MRSLAGAALPLLSLLAAAAACSSSISKRPARPAAPPAPQPSPAVAAAPSPPPQPTPPPRTNVSFPTYHCPHPYSEYYCLNDAKCFTVLIQDAPLYNCECRDGFVGQRCEYKDLDGSYLLSKGRVMLEKASIATGAAVALLLFCFMWAGAWALFGARAKRLAPPSPGVRPLRCGTQSQQPPNRQPPNPAPNPA